MKKKKGVAGQGQTPPKKPSAVKYTPVHLARRVLGLVKGRTDYIGIGGSEGMRPQRRGDSPLTPQEFASFHLTGIRCFAIYLMLRDDTVWCSCVDFDNKPERPDPEWRVKATKVYQCLEAHGLQALVEVSQSGRAAHVWIFFERPMDAWLVRVFWYRVLEHLKIPTPEVFPRQDSLRLTGKKLGNSIRLPLFNKSHFVDVEHDWKAVPPAKALAAVVKVTPRMLKSCSHRLGFELARPTSGGTASAIGASNAGGPPGRVQQLLRDEPNGFLAKRWNGDTTGLKDTSRSSLVFSIACALICSYLPTDDVEAAIRHWCMINRYEKGDRDDWVETTIDGAYKLLFESSLVPRRLRADMEGLCDPTGPVAREFRKRLSRRTY